MRRFRLALCVVAVGAAIGDGGCGNGQRQRVTTVGGCPDAADVSEIIGSRLHTAHNAVQGNGVRLCNYFEEGVDDVMLSKVFVWMLPPGIADSLPTSAPVKLVPVPGWDGGSLGTLNRQGDDSSQVAMHATLADGSRAGLAVRSTGLTDAQLVVAFHRLARLFGIES